MVFGSSLMRAVSDIKRNTCSGVKNLSYKLRIHLQTVLSKDLGAFCRCLGVCREILIDYRRSSKNLDTKNH